MAPNEGLKKSSDRIGQELIASTTQAPKKVPVDSKILKLTRIDLITHLDPDDQITPALPSSST